MKHEKLIEIAQELINSYHQQVVVIEKEIKSIKSKTEKAVQKKCKPLEVKREGILEQIKGLENEIKDLDGKQFNVPPKP